MKNHLDQNKAKSENFMIVKLKKKSNKIHGNQGVIADLISLELSSYSKLFNDPNLSIKIKRSNK
jgi:hypothetical protein